MLRILVTGSHGKIGKELVNILTEHDVLQVDKKCGLNLNDEATLKRIKEFEPEVVFHLAASFERTDETPQFHRINQEDNILATYNLNKALSEIEAPKHYIYASSYLVYDPSLYLDDVVVKNPIELSEVHEISPRNLIGASKLYGECESNFLKRNIHKDMNVAHARIFRVFGEGGQEFVSRIIEWKKLGIKVDIWKPENRFDYIHTSDCAQALKALIGKNGPYNIGSGLATSIHQIIMEVKPLLRVFKQDDKYEASVADITKICEETGWVPKVNVLDWIRRQM